MESATSQRRSTCSISCGDWRIFLRVARALSLSKGGSHLSWNSSPAMFGLCGPAAVDIGL